MLLSCYLSISLPLGVYIDMFKLIYEFVIFMEKKPPGCLFLMLFTSFNSTQKRKEHNGHTNIYKYFDQSLFFIDKALSSILGHFCEMNVFVLFLDYNASNSIRITKSLNSAWTADDKSALWWPSHINSELSYIIL